MFICCSKKTGRASYLSVVIIRIFSVREKRPSSAAQPTQQVAALVLVALSAEEGTPVHRVLGASQPTWAAH